MDLPRSSGGPWLRTLPVPGEGRGGPRACRRPGRQLHGAEALLASPEVAGIQAHTRRQSCQGQHRGERDAIRGWTGVARIPVLTAVTDLSLFSWDRSSWTTESLASRELLLNPRSVGHPSSDVCYPGDLGDILGHSGVILPVPCPEPWDRGPRCTPEA